MKQPIICGCSMSTAIMYCDDGVNWTVFRSLREIFRASEIMTAQHYRYTVSVIATVIISIGKLQG